MTPLLPLLLPGPPLPPPGLWVGGWMPDDGDIWPCDVGVCAIMGEPPGGGEPPGSGAPPDIMLESPPPPGPAFIIFLYLDRRFWNQIFTWNGIRKRER